MNLEESHDLSMIVGILLSQQQQQGWERKPAGPIAMSCLREPAVSGAEKEEEGEEEEEERFRTSVAGAVSETEPDRPTFSAAARWGKEGVVVL